MSYITKRHNQTILYWSTPISDGYGGKTFTTPVEISGRWEDKQVLFVNSTGEQIMSEAIVYLGQDVNLGGYLFLGELTDIASSIDETNPKNVEGAKEIKSFNKIPNIRATSFSRKVFL